MKANLLRAKMAEHQLTQREVAQRMGLRANSLSRKMLGKSEFTLPEVEKLCCILKIDNPAQIFLDNSSYLCNDNDSIRGIK